MKPLKKLLRNEAVRAVLCWLGAQYIRLVHLTGRWSVVRGDIPRRYWDKGNPFILCFWHGRLLMIPYCWRGGVAIHTLTSRHPDGRLLARTTAHFGIRTVTGSTTRGGVGALKTLVRLLRSGDCIGVTPDGPRGPRMRATDGVVALARLSGAPIIPVTYGTDRRRVLSTWDRFIVALPFGRGVLVWGEPIHVPADAGADDLEAVRRQVEATLNEITADADRWCGCQPIEPAATAEGAAS